MNESLKVSVILAVYNGEQFVRESIESVLNQTHSNIQLIIINDGSTDQTDKIIREIKDDRIEIVTLPENRHISYATNVGMEKATGDYLAIIDSDDRWRNDKLEIQLEYLQAHPEHEGCFSWVDLIDKNGDVVNDRYLGIYKLFACQTETRKAWLRFFFFKGNRLSNPSSIVSMKAAKAVGKHDRFYIQAQDMDWWVRFTKKFSFGVIEEPLTQMRMREGGNTSNYGSRADSKTYRFYNEMMQIRYHFFDDMDAELFKEVFQEDFRDPLRA